MKTLIVVRHGKSLHDDYVHSDLQRHLNRKGYQEAKKAAEWMEQQGVNPDLLVSSPAIRAFTTAVIFAQHMAYPPGNIQLRNEIYEATASALLYVLRSLEDEPESVAIFGHNPGFSDLVKSLAPGSLEHLVTAGLAILTFDIENWVDLAPATGKLTAVFGS
jgi:phosphohistidine phosphatase